MKNLSTLFTKFIVFTLIGICIEFFSSCKNVNSFEEFFNDEKKFSAPLTFKKNEIIKINLPDWNEIFSDKNFLKLKNWKIVVTNKYGLNTIFLEPGKSIFEVEVSKDNFSSILIYPIIENVGEFFEPAGAVYPTDFCKNANSIFEATATFQNGTFSKIIQSLFFDERFFKNEQFLYYFNFEKLKNVLEKNENDFINSLPENLEKNKFKNFENSKLTCDLDIEDIVEKIFNPPERLYLKYKKIKSFDFSSENFQTSISSNFSDSATESKIDSSNNSPLEQSDKIFHSYIPMNKIKNEHGIFFIQENLDNEPYTFLIDGRVICFNKNDL